MCACLCVYFIYLYDMIYIYKPYSLYNDMQSDHDHL